MSIVIGVDPDSKKHGIAIYKYGKLDDLLMMSLPEIVEDVIKCVPYKNRGVIWSIEDVMHNQFIYSRNANGNKTIQSKIAMYVGRNQQSFVELVRMLEHHGIKPELYKPNKGNWAKNKTQFQNVTGWTASSNEDTRSAAYFGWLAITNTTK